MDSKLTGAWILFEAKISVGEEIIYEYFNYQHKIICSSEGRKQGRNRRPPVAAIAATTVATVAASSANRDFRSTIAVATHVTKLSMPSHGMKPKSPQNKWDG